jgi:hypothetical protein
MAKLLKLGFTLAQSTVARYMYRGPPSQGWRTFLNNHAEGIAAIDLFVLPIPAALLPCDYAPRASTVGIVRVTTNPTAEWISRQITEAFPWDSAPRYLIRTGTRPMARFSGSVCALWAFGISRPLPDRRGETRTSRG